MSNLHLKAACHDKADKMYSAFEESHIAAEKNQDITSLLHTQNALLRKERLLISMILALIILQAIQILAIDKAEFNAIDPYGHTIKLDYWT